MSEMTDLKLIDELLCAMKWRDHPVTWEQMEAQSSIVEAAMSRLRAAYRSGEMDVITLALAEYFDGKNVGHVSTGRKDGE